MNFLVLVVVLKLVLFAPVTRAMARREASIAEQLRTAAEREAEARAEADAHRDAVRELETERAAQLDAAAKEAAERRRELTAAAHDDGERLRSGWEEALRRDRRVFLDEVRRRSGEQVVIVSRRVLADLADADLETRVVLAAVRQLREADAVVGALEGTGGADRRVEIRSAFALTDDTRAELTAALVDRLGVDPAEVSVRVDPALVCGLEVVVGGWSVGWSVDDYLDAVVEELGALLPADGVGEP
ncbi:MAG TPA: F0F1 ATP synthase subunit delta [Acidimicrobiales bacterium]|nr:F0F1 ATP synthase subunit delta [Acidimicrobiales bacterium]